MAGDRRRRRLILGSAAAIAVGGWSTATAAKKPRGPAGRSSKPAKADRRDTLDDDAPDIVTYGRRDDVLRFADDAAARHDLDAAWLRTALEQARFIPAVARLIMPAPLGVPKNWGAYRARFVEPVRIRAGTAFWRQNEAWLAKAEALHGVPPEVVVGIIGVESIYGRHMGSFRVVDSLATLAFDFPTSRRDRSEFFRGELEQWFVLCRREAVDPLSWRGSYAGAIGMPQFLPSSFNAHAVDFDGDGRIDLHTDAADAIGSVARYLAAYGWVRGVPARFDVVAPNDTSARAAMLVPDIVPSFSATAFAERGAMLDEAGRGHAGALALIELQNGTAAPSYVAGTTNFYAITRYNWSSYYALAVVELGEAVRRTLDRSTPAR